MGWFVIDAHYLCFHFHKFDQKYVLLLWTFSSFLIIWLFTTFWSTFSAEKSEQTDSRVEFSFDNWKEVISLVQVTLKIGKNCKLKKRKLMQSIA